MSEQKQTKEQEKKPAANTFFSILHRSDRKKSDEEEARDENVSGV